MTYSLRVAIGKRVFVLGTSDTLDAATERLKKMHEDMEERRLYGCDFYAMELPEAEPEKIDGTMEDFAKAAVELAVPQDVAKKEIKVSSGIGGWHSG